ncbi:hypothetical protein DICVIV_11101 [Dictyocaulus viviparus]|uniref:Uncharacterized protein n=1 Tax=Dictyocaulus viviparus TaxID=29172 RepID=A0A0D8XE75_DICVI|nr:hypothetical protein DICVIV_11101 [Dictyocaulus viviparus]
MLFVNFEIHSFIRKPLNGAMWVGDDQFVQFFISSSSKMKFIPIIFLVILTFVSAQPPRTIIEKTFISGPQPGPYGPRGQPSFARGPYGPGGQSSFGRGPPMPGRGPTVVKKTVVIHNG